MMLNPCKAHWLRYDLMWPIAQGRAAITDTTGPRCVDGTEPDLTEENITVAPAAGCC